MVIVQDQRPRDWAYMVAFKEKDLPSLQKMMKHIRETHDTDMIESFNQKCEQKLSGQTAVFKGLEIQQVSKTADLVTNPGLQQCLNIILGTSATRWSHIQSGWHDVASTPGVGDTTLPNTSGGGAAGTKVLSLATSGWSESKGMKLFFGAFASQDAVTPLGTTSITDIGVFNTATPNGAVMLNHESFFNNKLTRNITQDLAVFANIFILSVVVEFCPVA